ncbi:MAG: RMD1 family protein, partial [Leptolyngbya sp. SIO3F4]|nr:RMD1 family protein [Leptolyngbya sp. SIO3F4]
MVALTTSAENPWPTNLPQLSPVPLGWSTDDRIVVCAHLVGERLIVKTLETTDALSTNPLIMKAGVAGCAVLLRYGVVVVFNLNTTEETQYLESLTPFVKE